MPFWTMTLRHGACPVIETDVLIVGSGPAGSSSASCLSTYGVSNMVITKYRWTANTPRAHITNQRAVEIMRDMGLEGEIKAKGTPQPLMGDTVFCTSLAGDELARLHTWGTHPARLADYTLASPCIHYDLPQDIFEPIILGERATPRQPRALRHRVPLARPGRRRRHGHGAGPADRRRATRSARST